jgi:hypothetical protein
MGTVAVLEVLTAPLVIAHSRRPAAAAVVGPAPREAFLGHVLDTRRVGSSPEARLVPAIQGQHPPVAKGLRRRGDPQLVAQPLQRRQPIEARLRQLANRDRLTVIHPQVVVTGHEEHPPEAGGQETEGLLGAIETVGHVTGQQQSVATVRADRDRGHLLEVDGVVDVQVGCGVDAQRQNSSGRLRSG